MVKDCLWSIEVFILKVQTHGLLHSPPSRTTLGALFDTWNRRLSEIEFVFKALFGT